MPCADSAQRRFDLNAAEAAQLHERLSLQARAASPLFGQSTQMLGASLGSGGQNGGLNPLYQIGGPRSAQLALKLLF
jgi:hypothetical protein